jgi:hypothetical protein
MMLPDGVGHGQDEAGRTVLLFEDEWQERHFRNRYPEARLCITPSERPVWEASATARTGESPAAG